MTVCLCPRESIKRRRFCGHGSNRDFRRGSGVAGVTSGRALLLGGLGLSRFETKLENKGASRDSFNVLDSSYRSYLAPMNATARPTSQLNIMSLRCSRAISCLSCRNGGKPQVWESGGRLFRPEIRFSCGTRKIAKRPGFRWAQ
jgi:hypothetical protein